MRAALWLALAPAIAFAGGSNYGVTPGSRDIAGKVSEWSVPMPRFARDPAPGPDGGIYIAVMNGNRIARFDTKTHEFRERTLPEGARPHGLVMAKDGRIFYTGHGNGSIGELDPASGKVISHDTSSRVGIRKAIVDAEGRFWYMGSHNGRLGVIQ